MTVMVTTTCFGLYWPSSGCLGNLRASYMHARARGVEISTYAQLDKPNQRTNQRTSLHTTTTPHLPRTTPPPHKQSYCLVYIHVYVLLSVMFHSVLPDPCFDSVCQATRMQRSLHHARAHAYSQPLSSIDNLMMANTGRNMQLFSSHSH